MQSTRRLFLSYSHRDAAIIAPIASLLRTAGAFVFRDNDNLVAGDDWQLVVAEEIAGADFVLVFWCEHSSISDEVRKEIHQALNLSKRLVPVLLDQSPLTPDIQGFHGIDMRGTTVGHRTPRENTKPDAGHYEIPYEPTLFGATVWSNRDLLEYMGVHVAAEIEIDASVYEAAIFLATAQRLVRGDGHGHRAESDA